MSRNKTRPFSLTLQDVEALKKIFDTNHYQVTQDIIYEGQTPHVGFVLVDGEVQLKKRNKVVKSIQDQSVIGINELVNNTKSSYSIGITKDSDVIILDRSSLNELKEGHQNLYEKITSAS